MNIRKKRKKRKDKMLMAQSNKRGKLKWRSKKANHGRKPNKGKQRGKV